MLLMGYLRSERRFAAGWLELHKPKGGSAVNIVPGLLRCDIFGIGKPLKLPIAD
jgi:hypothetical protein